MSFSLRLPYDILALVIALPPAYPPIQSLLAWSLVSRETSWLARRALYRRWEVEDDFRSYCRFLNLFAHALNPGPFPSATSFLKDLTLHLPSYSYVHLPLPNNPAPSKVQLKTLTLILPRATARLETHHVPLLRLLGRPERVVVRLAEGSEDGYVWMGGEKKREVSGWLDGKLGWVGSGEVKVEVVGSDSGDESSFEWSSNREV